MRYGAGVTVRVITTYEVYLERDGDDPADAGDKIRWEAMGLGEHGLKRLVDEAPHRNARMGAQLEVVSLGQVQEVEEEDDDDGEAA